MILLAAKETSQPKIMNFYWFLAPSWRLITLSWRSMPPPGDIVTLAGAF